MPIIVKIVWQYAEQATMIRVLRRAATELPHYSLADLAKIDG